MPENVTKKEYEEKIEKVCERMRHFEVWFQLTFERLDSLERDVRRLQQEFFIWIEGKNR